MKEVLLLDFKSVFRNNKFKLIALIIFSIPVITFLFNCYRSMEIPIELVRSGAEQNFLTGMSSREIKLWFILILPLLSMLLCSDIYSIQYNNGTCDHIITRCGNTKYILSKIIVVFTVTFGVIFISLLTNQILTLIAFPAKALDSARNLPAFDIGYFNYHKSEFLDIIRVKNIYIYNVIYELIYALIGGAYSLSALGLSFFVKKSRIFILALFVVYFGIYQIFSSWGLDKYHINSYLDASGAGNYVFILWIIVLTVIPSLLTIIHLNNKNDI